MGSQMSQISQMSQMSQMSLSLSLSLSGLKGCSLYFKSKSTVTKSSHMSRMSRMSEMSQMSQMSQTCLLITLIKCLKDHKSLGSLCSVVKTLIVSGNGPTDGRTMSPIELFWTAKNQPEEKILREKNNRSCEEKRQHPSLSPRCLMSASPNYHYK